MKKYYDRNTAPLKWYHAMTVLQYLWLFTSCSESGELIRYQNEGYLFPDGYVSLVHFTSMLKVVCVLIMWSGFSKFKRSSYFAVMAINIWGIVANLLSLAYGANIDDIWLLVLIELANVIYFWKREPLFYDHAETNNTNTIKENVVSAHKETANFIKTTDVNNAKIATYKIKYCRKCGSSIKEDDLFCEHCGAKIL